MSGDPGSRRELADATLFSAFGDAGSMSVVLMLMIASLPVIFFCRAEMAYDGEETDYEEGKESFSSGWKASSSTLLRRRESVSLVQHK